MTDEVSAPDDLEPTSLRSAPADGLELHWSFESNYTSSGDTIIYDLSGNGRNGTLEDGAALVSSPWGQAVSLDGVDDYISFVGPRDPDDFGGASTGEFTISARVKVDDADRYNTLCRGCAPNDVFSVGTSNSGRRLYGEVYKPSDTTKSYPLSDNPSVSASAWTTVTMVVEAGVGTNYYVNCEHNEEVLNSDTGLHDYNYSAVGEGFDANSYFDGQIDDLKVWSRALSAAEIEELCPCNGAPEAETLAIEPPRAPGWYAPPTPNGTTIVSVNTTLGLKNAAVNAGVEQIVVADGTYTPNDLPLGYLKVKKKKIWAEHPGKAVLKFGVETGGYVINGDVTDSELHGLVLDVDDVDNVPFDGSHHNLISNWGDATGLVVEDCVLHGNGYPDFGIRVTTTADGFEARRLEIDGMTQVGIHVGDGGTISTPVVLEDIRIWDITDGANAGIGMRIQEQANIARIHVRDIRWSGIVINGESDGSNLTDIDIDRAGTTETTGRVGVYFDDIAKNSTLSQFCIGSGVQDGVRSEWDHNSVSTCLTVPPEDLEDCLEEHTDVYPRGINNAVEDGLIEASRMGVSFDRGTVDGTVDGVTFRNADFSAIMFHDNVSSPTVWPYYDDGSQQTNNTFQECGVCSLTYDHPNNGTPTCVVAPPC